MLSFSMPTPQSRFLNADGTVSREWFMFMSSLLQTVGGPNVVPGGGIPPIEIQQQWEDYPLTVPEAIEALRGVDELRNEIAYAKNQVQMLLTAIDELQVAVAAVRVPTDLRNRVQDIEDRLA